MATSNGRNQIGRARCRIVNDRSIWTTGEGQLVQVEFKFGSLMSAASFAELQGIPYRVEESDERRTKWGSGIVYEQSVEFEVLMVDTNSSSYEQEKRASERVLAQQEQNSKRELDRRLDQALEETFPASDAVSVIIAL